MNLDEMFDEPNLDLASKRIKKRKTNAATYMEDARTYGGQIEQQQADNLAKIIADAEAAYEAVKNADPADQPTKLTELAVVLNAFEKQYDIADTFRHIERLEEGK